MIFQLHFVSILSLHQMVLGQFHLNLPFLQQRMCASQNVFSWCKLLIKSPWFEWNCTGNNHFNLHTTSQHFKTQTPLVGFHFEQFSSWKTRGSYALRGTMGHRSSYLQNTQRIQFQSWKIWQKEVSRHCPVCLLLFVVFLFHCLLWSAMPKLIAHSMWMISCDKLHRGNWYLRYFTDLRYKTTNTSRFQFVGKSIKERYTVVQMYNSLCCYCKCIFLLFLFVLGDLHFLLLVKQWTAWHRNAKVHVKRFFWMNPTSAMQTYRRGKCWIYSCHSRNKHWYTHTQLPKTIKLVFSEHFATNEREYYTKQ